ncbi:MAG: IPT/TIG domain-containing protein [Acidobacteria bacterium]|nr:IPT/TIG domain-containing protein [Acidobacteriota bacterium]
MSLCLLLLVSIAPAAAESVRVAWDPNPEPDIAGYVLAWGVSAETYTESVTVTAGTATHEITALAPGTYYFAIRAFNSAGMYSGYSNQVAAVVSSTTLPALTIAAVSPALGPVAGGTSVTISGTGFQAGAVVSFGSNIATVLSQTTTGVTVRTPAGPVGAVAVSVANPDGGSATGASAFTYTSVNPPTVTSVSPTSGPPAGGTVVTIVGSNFQNGAIVRFGSVAATVTSTTATRLIAVSPAQAKGAVSLTVLNLDGNGVTVPKAFSYRGGSPSVRDVTPTSGSTSGGTDIIIEGAAFDPGVSVAVDGVTAAVVSATSTRLVVRMPPHAPKTVGLTITNPDAQLAWVPFGFTYVENAPSIAAISPDAGPAGGGNSVVISGSAFAPAAAVLVDDQPVAITAQSSTAITLTMPAHAIGAVSVMVRNPDSQSATIVNGYTYEDRGGDTFTRYFAEGAAGDFFQTRFAVANPHDEAVPLTVTFTDTLGTATPMTLSVPARARVTIDGSNRPPLASEAFSTKFEAPRVLGVERTVSWAAGGPIYGAHSETGVAAPRTSWVLAEGATIGGFNTFYLLQNPTTTGAEVKVQYLLSTGERIEKIHPVAPLSRTNIWVNKDDPALASAEMSATLTSMNGVPVVVERSMYRNNGDELFSAGHNSAAVDAPSLRWFLAEGATGGTFDEFVLIANPNDAAANLRVSYLRAGQAPLVKSYTAPAQSRLTIWVDQEAPELAAAEVSIMVESLTATPVVVERSMWWKSTPTGEWVEAHNSRGVTTTAARWLVADGESGGPGEASTYVLVANTGNAPAPVRFTLLTEAGTTRTVQDTVTANGRYSLDVAGAFPEARGTRFSVLVEGVSGTATLVVERASYSSTPGTTWASGTNSLAMPLP